MPQKHGKVLSFKKQLVQNTCKIEINTTQFICQKHLVAKYSFHRFQYSQNSLLIGTNRCNHKKFKAFLSGHFHYSTHHKIICFCIQITKSAFKG